MEEKKKRKSGSLIFKILIFIIIILLFIYFGISYDILNFKNNMCSNYINPLNISYVEGTREWSSDCKRIKIENFEVEVSEYSFDDGQTWQESNIYEVCGEQLIKAKIRDKDEKILGEGTFKVENIDNIPPILEIDKDLTVKVGNEVDLTDGVKASDNESGLNGGVRVTPTNIDIWKSGETEVSYTATDNAGNKTTKTRKVIVTGTLNVTTFYLTPANLYLKKGDTYTVKPVYYPSNLSSNLITWKSSNTNVVTVDRKGNLNALANGTATITAQMGNKTSSMIVVVGNNTGTTTPTVINPTAVYFSLGSYTVKVGETVTPGIILSPSNAIRNFTYYSNNNNIATYKNGVVTGIAPGTATISVTTSNGKTAMAQVTVINKTGTTTPSTNPTSITLPQQVNVKPGDTKKLDVTILPSTATGYTVTCTSNNTSIATIDNNYNIKGIKVGNAIITCKTSNGLMANTIVVVDNGITDLKITPNVLDLTKGETEQLIFTFTPITVRDDVACSSSNTSVATVSSNNVVTAKGVGNATITCRIPNGVNSSINVNVKPKVVTMYRYRDSSVKQVDCNCREEETSKCETCKWWWENEDSGSRFCDYAPQDSEFKRGSGCGTCCTSYKQWVCSKCNETVWSDWSEWSTTPVTSSSTRQVETKQVEQ